MSGGGRGMAARLASAIACQRPQKEILRALLSQASSFWKYAPGSVVTHFLSGVAENRFGASMGGVALMWS